MKLIGYARVSSESQEENTSLQEQERKIKAYCEAMSHELTGISVEVASGASLKRPALQSVLEYLPTIDGIIVLKLDRLSRSLKDTVNLIAELNDGGKHLVAVEQQLDTSSSNGRLFVNIMASFAEYERELINERTQGGRKAKLLAGGYAYGKPKFGMKSSNGELVPHEEEKGTIELIKRHRRSGKSYSAIAEYLNKKEIRPKHGVKWYHRSVKLVLGR
jgi:DNA invertase Pin-like site-specific DNA recombinase